MTVAILSDEFYHRRFQYDFDHQYQGDVEFYSWTDSIDSGIQAECIVLDLAFDSRTNGGHIISDGVGDIRTRLNRLKNNITHQLETGKVAIALIAPEFQTRGLMNQPTNYDWLDHLQAVSRVEHQTPRTQISVVSEIPGIQQYFDFTAEYQYGIRLNESTITAPEILAQNKIDRETVAVAFSEYLDPDGNHREPPGRVVLLPQPTDLDSNFLDLVESLEKIGNHYLELREAVNLLDGQGRVDLENVLEKGEGDTIEFKEELPSNAHDFAKDMVAFTNKWGGVLIVGIDDEDYSIKGVTDVDEVKNRVAGVGSKAIDPPIDPIFETHLIDGERVVVARIKSGQGPLYTTSEKVYWRFGPTSESVSGSDIEKYILPR